MVAKLDENTLPPCAKYDFFTLNQGMPIFIPMALASLLLAITQPSLLDSTTIGVCFKSGRKTLSHEA